MNGTLESATRYLNNVFFKRVYVINDYVNSEEEDKSKDQRLVFLNFCARTNTTFVDVNKILKTIYW